MVMQLQDSDQTSQSRKQVKRKIKMERERKRVINRIIDDNLLSGFVLTNELFLYFNTYYQPFILFTVIIIIIIIVI